MIDAVTIGSALVDIFVTSSDFELQKTGEGVFLCQMYGAKIEIDNFELATGGGGGNVAVGLARAGLSVATVVEMGKDFWSQVVLKELQDNHVDTEYIVREKKEQTGGSVVLIGQDGGRTVMVHRGAAALLDPDDIPPRAFERARLVHLSSIAGRAKTLDRIFSLAKKNQVSLSWNPGSAELALLAGGDLACDSLPVQTLFVNQEEWQMIEQCQTQLRKLIPEIIVTAGKNGLDIYSESSCNHIDGRTGVQVLDETGAGDAFAAGYLAGRYNHLAPEQAVTWGLDNAVSVISHIGAKPGLLSYSELANSSPDQS